MIDKKQLILKFLKKNGMSATSRIATEIKSNIWMARVYLDDLLKDKKVKKTKETLATFWELKE